MGWTFNTVNPDAPTYGPTITAVGIAFTTVSLIVVCLRMYVRGCMIKALGVGKSNSHITIKNSRSNK